MQQLARIWRFGTPFLNPYHSRFVFGVILGVIFRLSNSLFFLVINVLFNHPTSAESVSAAPYVSSRKIFRFSPKEGCFSLCPTRARSIVETTKSSTNRRLISIVWLVICRIWNGNPANQWLIFRHAGAEKNLGLWDSLLKAVPISICSRDCLKHLLWCFQWSVCFVDQYLV